MIAALCITLLIHPLLVWVVIILEGVVFKVFESDFMEGEE